MIDWVDANRAGFSALVHIDSGDDFKDHTDGSRWLGKKLPLDFSFFELIQVRPEFRINRDEADLNGTKSIKK